MSKKSPGRDNGGGKVAAAASLEPAVTRVAVLGALIFGLIEVLRVVLLQG